jgi:hypothetical protein
MRWPATETGHPAQLHPRLATIEDGNLYVGYPGKGQASSKVRQSTWLKGHVVPTVWIESGFYMLEHGEQENDIRFPRGRLFRSIKQFCFSKECYVE